MTAVSNNSNGKISSELKKFFDNLPNELVEKILIYAITSSEEKFQTYSILGTCSRFNYLIKNRRQVFLPRVYICPIVEKIPQLLTFILPCMRKLINYYGQSSGVVLRLAETINNHKWKPAWVILTDRIYWKSSIDKAVLAVDDDKENWMPELDDFWMKNGLYNLKIEDK